MATQERDFYLNYCDMQRPPCGQKGQRKTPGEDTLYDKSL